MRSEYVLRCPSLPLAMTHFRRELASHGARRAGIAVGFGPSQIVLLFRVVAWRHLESKGP